MKQAIVTGEDIARLTNELVRYQRVMRKIADIPLGPDKGSAQSQIDCAVEYASKALRKEEIDDPVPCKCCSTGKYVWVERCVVHPVRDPWAYSLDELQSISQDAKHGIFPKTQRRGD